MTKGDKMLQVIEKVEKELEKLGLTIDDVANEHIIEACTAKVALVDNLTEANVDFDEIEQKLYPDSTFVNTMVQHLDKGGSGEDMVSAFLVGAIYYSPELQKMFEFTPMEEE